MGEHDVEDAGVDELPHDAERAARDADGVDPSGLLEREERLDRAARGDGCREPDPLGIVQVQERHAVEAEPVETLREGVVDARAREVRNPGLGSTFVAST